MKLLFKKNKLISYKINQRNCPCYKDEIEKCFYGIAEMIKINKNFKDEPEEFVTYFNCSFRRYIGPQGMAFNKITREFYEETLRKNTLCTHPYEGEEKSEWRCYKCNQKVEFETERHNCYGIY